MTVPRVFTTVGLRVACAIGSWRHWILVIAKVGISRFIPLQMLLIVSSFIRDFLFTLLVYSKMPGSLIG
jgi:hypothetical protein